ncbi:alpha/beta hydrolase [Actinoallomurus rhizosphaericola]|uniref:alpha/beta hydrolase n=1 Tax=Actinoallomurus rhizosphaericola TaxID=2952536 RepID=UPI002091019F|nr:alpha/beta hydrolase [Actinoallomurus rhizosphaericola]MCO5993629.1 alpha/beta hydrolase family protein [Actinoallomurus rhizosphaericola]
MNKRRAALVTLVAGGVMLTTAAAGGHASVPPPPVQPLPALTGPALAARYAAERQAIEAAARRDPRLAPLAAPGRTFVAFDPRGRAVEVVGDLATARRVAILVPGSDTTLHSFDSRGTASPGGGARAVLAEARRIDPHARLAVIAWLGYSAPRTISLDVATTTRADQGARALRPLVDTLNAHGAAVSLLCHSYGSVVCGRAAHDVEAADIAVFGSPGMAVSSAADLRTRARLWAGRGSGDWMAYVPKVRVLGLGFGADPVGRSFGARVFAAGNGGHSDYLRPGGIALRNLALIALGRGAEVSRVR